MQPISVFAAATSRLHADLIIIRLRRAGISARKISALFPEHSKPNCAECWLEGISKPVRYTDEMISIAGPMRKRLFANSEAKLAQSLQTVGLGISEANACAERVSHGQILLAVETDDQAEIAITWHTFRQLEAEGITLGLSDETPNRRWFGRVPRPEAETPALSLSVAV